MTKEEMREYHREYRAKNREHINNRKRLWRMFKKNPELKQLYSQMPKERRERQNFKPPKYLYSVWNNYTDELIILDGTVKQCADAMGISYKSFHTIRTRLKQGTLKKWTIEMRVAKP